MRAEWRKAPDFHEYAEAVGCRTDQVFSVADPMRKGSKGPLVVLFTPRDDDDLIYSAVVKRDRDGILRVQGKPKPQPELWKKIQAAVEREMRRDAE